MPEGRSYMVFFRRVHLPTRDLVANCLLLYLEGYLDDEFHECLRWPVDKVIHLLGCACSSSQTDSSNLCGVALVMLFTLWTASFHSTPYVIIISSSRSGLFACWELPSKGTVALVYQPVVAEEFSFAAFPLWCSFCFLLLHITSSTYLR